MLGVGPRSPEAVIELATFSIQSGGAVGTALLRNSPTLPSVAFAGSANHA